MLHSLLLILLIFLCLQGFMQGQMRTKGVQSVTCVPISSSHQVAAAPYHLYYSCHTYITCFLHQAQVASAISMLALIAPLISIAPKHKHCSNKRYQFYHTYIFRQTQA